MLNIFINFEKIKIMEYSAENIEKMLALTKEGKREFLDNLYEFLNENKLTALDYQRIKILSTAPFVPDVIVNM